MKKRWIIVLIIITIFTACAPKQPEQDTDIVVMQANNDAITPKKTTCDYNYEEGPHPNSNPDPITVTPPQTPVTFTWEYDCIPDEYQMLVTHYGDENASLFLTTFIPPDSYTNSYTKDANLEPATYYQWSLDAIMHDDELEGSPEWAFFHTGPMCGVQDLVAPTLVSPADGTIDTGKGWGNVTEVNAIIKYPAGQCLPDYFEIEYSTNTSFIENTNLNPSGPSFGKKENGWLYYNDDSSATQNCNLYYWRARALADGNAGDWSETFSFFLDVYGNCYKFPEFKALQNANCRKDPWAGENYVSVLWEGDTAELLGLNKDATWGMFKLKNELECWINMALVETDPPDALYFPGFYPVIETGEPPVGGPAAQDPDDEPLVGCMAPSGRSGQLTCQIPCPDPDYATRVCP